MSHSCRLAALALLLTSPAFAADASSALTAWARLSRRYPILGQDINIVRRSPDVLGNELRQFIQRYPKAPQTARAIYLLGRCHMSRREMSVSHETFWQAVDRFPQTEWADKSAQMIVGMHGAVGLWQDAHVQLDRLEKALPKPKLIAELTRKLYAMEHMQLGKPAMTFDVKDTEGRPMSLAAHKGKVVLLVFWATWCPPCRAEMPHLLDAHRRFGGKGLVVLGVSLDQDVDALRGFCEKAGITWPNYCDGKKWENALALKFDIAEVPQTYLIDRNGILRYKNTRGPLLRTRVKRMIEGKVEDGDEGIWE